MTVRTADRRDHLLDTAIMLFLRKGVRSSSVDEIAKLARISKGAVYLEFTSKHALIDAAVRRELSRYITETCLRIEADPDGGRLSRIYHHSISALLDQPFMRAIYEDNGQILDGILRGPERYRSRILLGTEFLSKLVDAGLLRKDIDLAVTSHLLSVLSVGPLLAEPLLRDATSPPLESTFGLLAELVVSGLESDHITDPTLGAKAFREFAEDIQSQISEPH